MVRNERGSASVLMVFMIPLLGLGALAMLAFAQHAVLRQQLRTAADMSALAAAQALGSSCERAQQIAAAHQVSVIACEVSGGEWTVGVSAPPAPFVSRLGELLGRDVAHPTQYATAGYADSASSM